MGKIIEDGGLSGYQKIRQWISGQRSSPHEMVATPISRGKSGQNPRPTCSTIVENPLQNGLFLQNKANFRKSQMDINLIITRNYEKNNALDTW